MRVPPSLRVTFRPFAEPVIDHLLGLHAQEPDFEDRRAGLGREGEGELALFIGRDALSRAAFQNDRCAGEHRLAGVAHGSAHGELAHLDRRVVDQHDVVLDGVFERRPGDALVEQFVYGDFLEFAAHGREPADVFGVVGEFDACLPGDFVEHRRRGSLRQRDGKCRVQVDRFTPPCARAVAAVQHNKPTTSDSRSARLKSCRILCMCLGFRQTGRGGRSARVLVLL